MWRSETIAAAASFRIGREEERRRLVVSSVAIERRSASLRSENHRQAKQWADVMAQSGNVGGRGHEAERRSHETPRTFAGGNVVDAVKQGGTTKYGKEAQAEQKHRAEETCMRVAAEQASGIEQIDACGIEQSDA